MKENYITPSVQAQTLVYVCNGMDDEVRSFAYPWSYEVCSGCVGGQIETTLWAEDTAAPILLAAAVSLDCDLVGTVEWYYEICEEYGHAIMTNARINDRWPDEDALAALAIKVVRGHK